MLINGIIIPFIAGFIAVLIFHQGVWAIFASAGKAPGPPWSMAKTGPLQVPAVVNSAFWGGLWGIVMVLMIVVQLASGGRHGLGRHVSGVSGDPAVSQAST